MPDWVNDLWRPQPSVIPWRIPWDWWFPSTWGWDWLWGYAILFLVVYFGVGAMAYRDRKYFSDEDRKTWLWGCPLSCLLPFGCIPMALLGLTAAGNLLLGLAWICDRLCTKFLVWLAE